MKVKYILKIWMWTLLVHYLCLCLHVPFWTWKSPRTEVAPQEEKTFRSLNSINLNLFWSTTTGRCWRRRAKENTKGHWTPFPKTELGEESPQGCWTYRWQSDGWLNSSSSKIEEKNHLNNSCLPKHLSIEELDFQLIIRPAPLARHRTVHTPLEVVILCWRWRWQPYDSPNPSLTAQTVAEGCMADLWLKTQKIWIWLRSQITCVLLTMR